MEKCFQVLEIKMRKEATTVVNNFVWSECKEQKIIRKGKHRGLSYFMNCAPEFKKKHIYYPLIGNKIVLRRESRLPLNSSNLRV